MNCAAVESIADAILRMARVNRNFFYFLAPSVADVFKLNLHFWAGYTDIKQISPIVHNLPLYFFHTDTGGKTMFHILIAEKDGKLRRQLGRVLQKIPPERLTGRLP